MTIKSTDYALLSQDSYLDRLKEQISGNPVFIGESTYQILDTENDRLTGYQGTAYQKLDANGFPTGEVIIAHRGSEFEREPLKDGAVADGGMIFTGLNAQAPVASAFTERVISKAREAAEKAHTPLHITVTGHSLGGALAELTAYKFHLHGETFNGFGAADLDYRIPEGGDLVTNYVRATDVVSAVSHHFGKVVVVATADDIRQLEHSGYHDHTMLRNPFGAISFDAHSITNFVDQPGRPSDLSMENEARARAYQSAISLYREDVHDLRANVLSLAWRMEQKKETALTLGAATATALLHDDRDTAQKLAELAVHRTADNLAYATHVAANTAILGITAINQAGAYVADNIKQSAHALNEVMAPVTRVIDRAGAYIADHVKHDAQQLAQSAQQTLQPCVQGIAHYADAARSLSIAPSKAAPVSAQTMTEPLLETQRLQEQQREREQKTLREREAAAAYRFDVTAITPRSSIDDMFEVLYQASVRNDHASMNAVSQAYMHSPHGQAFLQQGRDYNQRLETQQAIQEQIARKEPAMSR